MRKYEKIKMIVSEIDGTITEHMNPIDELGNTPFKTYYMKDFEAINELKKHFKFAFVSSDNAISYHLCQRKNIPFFWASKNSKWSTKRDCLAEIRVRYGVDLDEILYVGCQYSDIECANMAGACVCPVDAPRKIKEISYATGDVLENTFGGTGVICVLLDEVLYEEINMRLRGE